MLDTLNLWSGDLVDAEIIRDVERRFGIKVTNADAEQLCTAGQLYDLIELKYAEAGRTKACLSQAAFYRLRRALNAMGAAAISPQTPLLVIDNLEPRSIAKKWRRLGRMAELDLPSLETPFGRWLPEYGTTAWRWLAMSGWAAGMTMFVCSSTLSREHVELARGWSLSLAVVAVAAIVFGAALWRLFFQTIPRRLITVGDLAREAAGYSFAKLVAEKKGSARSDRWSALAAIIRLASGHKAAITRDTTFFAVHAKPVD
jgi:hypothetical protein